MNRRLLLIPALVVAFCALSFRLPQIPIAGGWIDPVLHFGAQDEATYTHEAIMMLVTGDWINPRLMGRLIFEKPPLLQWSSALAMKLFGIAPLTARLPAVLSGVLVAVLAFWIAAATRSRAAGAAAFLLCLFNPLLFTMSRHNMIDMPLTGAILLSCFVLSRDPELSRGASRTAFAVSIAAAILLKSVAGLLPVLAALLAAALSAEKARTRLLRTAATSAIGLLLASPWFLYQWFVHRDWFLGDLGFQILNVGVTPQQTSAESHLGFYALRLAYAAPPALLLLVSGLPRLVRALRQRETVPLLLLCYSAVIAAALLAFQFHSEQYLTPLLPFLILLACITGWSAAPALAAIAVWIAVEAASPLRPWGISYQAGSTVAAAQVLRSYCEERRGNNLYVAGVGDEFYALSLPLPRVRYGWLDPANAIEAARPHLKYLGVVQGVHELGQNTSLYAARLAAWGLHSTAPLATAITASDIEGLASLLATHPNDDFLVSPEVADHSPAGAAHIVRSRGPGYVLLESPTSPPAPPQLWSCRM